MTQVEIEEALRKKEERIRLKEELRIVKQTVSTYMKDAAAGEPAIQALRKNAHVVGSDSARTAGKRMLSERGVKAPINELGYRELQMYMDFVKAYDDYYKRK